MSMFFPPDNLTLSHTSLCNSCNCVFVFLPVIVQRKAPLRSPTWPTQYLGKKHNSKLIHWHSIVQSIIYSWLGTSYHWFRSWKGQHEVGPIAAAGSGAGCGSWTAAATAAGARVAVFTGVEDVDGLGRSAGANEVEGTGGEVVDEFWRVGAGAGATMAVSASGGGGAGPEDVFWASTREPVYGQRGLVVLIVLINQVLLGAARIRLCGVFSVAPQDFSSALWPSRFLFGFSHSGVS